MLLSKGSGLSEAAAEQLTALEPQSVALLGGEGSLSAQVITDIEALGYPVERIAETTGMRHQLQWLSFPAGRRSCLGRIW
ncbi:hypothetical protein [Ornithinimicrobium sp. INDO-MA30-4]|uniref:hypothetical protein n=1 Tax=Ornithinimicrobium sp. INDO-MA30-4 TaxID=2908651 RepID=UPI001F33BB60|nr:hypothetical protein [Ornithinimicrobium sp. INDO-MA30-4]UJH69935.1 hypothetical protein L0A91_11975 [Ornithinimicrobium sp. INDO-MA30-4]